MSEHELLSLSFHGRLGKITLRTVIRHTELYRAYIRAHIYVNKRRHLQPKSNSVRCRIEVARASNVATSSSSRKHVLSVLYYDRKRKRRRSIFQQAECAPDDDYGLEVGDVPATCTCLYGGK